MLLVLNSFCSTDGDSQIIVGRIPNLIHNLINIISYRLNNGENEIIDDHFKDDYIYLVTEYHSKGSLGDHIKSINAKFNDHN